MNHKTAVGFIVAAFVFFAINSCSDTDDELQKVAAQELLENQRMRVIEYEADIQDLTNMLFSLQTDLDLTNKKIRNIEQSKSHSDQLHNLTFHKREIESSIQTIESRIKSTTDSMQHVQLAINSIQPKEKK